MPKYKKSYLLIIVFMWQKTSRQKLKVKKKKGDSNNSVFSIPGILTL